MVLESIIGKKNIRKHPIFVFFLTILICGASLLLAKIMFPVHSSVLSVAFITIGLVPLVYNVLSDEEADEVVNKGNSAAFFARHFNLIMIYVWIFVGIIFSFALIYVAFPTFSSVVEAVSTPISPIFGFAPFKSCVTLNTCDSAKEELFSEQISSFCGISKLCKAGVPLSITANASGSPASVCSAPSTDVVGCVWYIFDNNAGVLILVILLSLLYGVGAIFIIVWNASILGIFFGEMILMGDVVRGVGMFVSLLIGHGPPELFAYVFGALAGGILSAMIARGELLTHSANIIIKDVLFLSFLAFFSVAYGALIEGVGLTGLKDFSVILGFLYVLVIIVAVFLYNSTRPSPHLSY